MTTKVYRYGIATPHENADVVRDQMRRAHCYRQVLTWIEHQRRDEERALRRASSEELRAAEDAVRAADAECEKLAGQISGERQKTRKRSETQGARAALVEARARLREAKQSLYAVREKQRSQCAACREVKSEENPCPHASPEAIALRLALDEVDARANETVKWVRNECAGLYWGTYLLVERAHRAACSSLGLYESDGVTPANPRAPRWDGSGAVAVQIQTGMPVEEALGGEHSQLRITAPPWAEAWLAEQPEPDVANIVRGHEPPGVQPLPREGGQVVRAPATLSDGRPARWVRRRAARHGELRMCVLTDKRVPTWAAWRLDMPRDLPRDGRILWAVVHLRRHGPHWEWSLCVTVETPSVEMAPRPGVIAIDVGWRQMDRELRVAAWCDDSGRSGELRLTENDIQALRQPEEIRSQRDAAFDACKATVRRWIDARQDVPEWMRAEARSMHAWRRAARMVWLLRRWLEERPERSADEAIVVEAVRAWAAGDALRWAEESSRRRWALRRRREVYRRFAAQVARDYGTIVLERFDLREVAVRKPVGEDEAENERARSNRQLAAVSELRLSIAGAAGSRCAVIEGVNPRDTTRICPSCGVVEDRDAAASVRLVCDACGHGWDQDVEGAAPVILTRRREQLGDVKILVGARWVDKGSERKEKKGGQWARARRMGSKKRARLEAARNAADKLDGVLSRRPRKGRVGQVDCES